MTTSGQIFLETPLLQDCVTSAHASAVLSIAFLRQKYLQNFFYRKLFFIVAVLNHIGESFPKVITLETDSDTVIHSLDKRYDDGGRQEHSINVSIDTRKA